MMIFEVDRDDYRRTRVAPTTERSLQPGQVRLAVERFAVTTNNITYAVAGDMLDYWGFFPSERPWGRIPVIGLGSVVESANSEIPVGGRYFGFFPMATELVVDAEARGRGRFRDVGPHRGDHAATYTDFRDVGLDQGWDPDTADQFLLLWGMFMTSFLVDDQLGDHGFHGASQTLVTSASSKTSISLASCLTARDEMTTVGLTSSRNREFVEGLGLYERVLTYDEIARLDPSVRSGLVDMAGNASVRAAIHGHFNPPLAFSISVGITHWEEAQPGDGTPLPEPRPEFFFAPAQRAKRVSEWGAEELDRRIDGAYRNLVAHSSGWLQVTERHGAAGIEATYRELLEGRADPRSGFVCVPDPDSGPD